MSNGESASASQTPRQEALNRVLEYLPQSQGILRLLGVETVANIQADARARTKDSHRLQMKQLYKITGEKMPELTDAEEEVISVAGDTINNITLPPDRPAAVKTGMSTLAKVGVGAALTAASVGLPALGAVAYALLNNPPAATEPVSPSQPATDRDTYLPYDFGIR